MAKGDAPASGACEGGSSWCEYAVMKEHVLRGLVDFKNVFLYPLCTGVMTGVGFIAGKRLGERYFYGTQRAS